MYEIEMINVEQFFARRGPELREIILQAAGQPPTPPIPPNTGIPANASPPDPDDFGFYVSFRFDQSLEKLKGPHSWGLYLSKSAISSIASFLTAQGCSPSIAWRIAHEFVYRTVEIEYMADCVAIHFDHLEWLRGGNPAISNFLLPQLHDLREIGIAYAHSCVQKEYRTQSKDTNLLQTAFNQGKKWKNQLARCFIEVYGTRFNAHVIWPNPAFPIKDLIRTVEKLIPASSPKKSPIGSALPVHYIP
jgi:hypothetical protein